MIFVFIFNNLAKFPTCCFAFIMPYAIAHLKPLDNSLTVRVPVKMTTQGDKKT